MKLHEEVKEYENLWEAAMPVSPYKTKEDVSPEEWDQYRADLYKYYITEFIYKQLDWNDKVLKEIEPELNTLCKKAVSITK